MVRDCKVKIKSSIVDDEGFMELLSLGKVDDSDGNFTIEYEDTAETGVASLNRIVVSGDVVVLNRFGEHSSTMVFEKGRSFSCALSTPYGDFPLTVFSHTVDFRRTDSNAELTLVYSIDVNGSMDVNELHLMAEYC